MVKIILMRVSHELRMLGSFEVDDLKLISQLSVWEWFTPLFGVTLPYTLNARLKVLERLYLINLVFDLSLNGNILCGVTI